VANAISSSGLMNLLVHNWILHWGQHPTASAGFQVLTEPSARRDPTQAASSIVARNSKTNSVVSFNGQTNNPRTKVGELVEFRHLFGQRTMVLQGLVEVLDFQVLVLNPQALCATSAMELDIGHVIALRVDKRVVEVLEAWPMHSAISVTTLDIGHVIVQKVGRQVVETLEGWPLHSALSVME